MATERATDVGIVAMEFYTPETCVDQSALEEYDGVSSGKYTIGLGQTKMAFTGDREDIHSICMTVVASLMEKYSISYGDIGRLEVGTETIIDKSKSVKTVLMQLFAESGNDDIEGIDCTNACYGGTNALFNSINWIESSSWDGRYALVVTGDIAVYAEGNARPTGGCGAVAMLIGPNAPLVFDSKLRASHFEHTYDFFKPDLASEYPTVDGPLTIKCYVRALDKCYDNYKAKYEAVVGEPFSIDAIDYAAFHCPFNKLVIKSFARFLYNDVRTNPDAFADSDLAQYATVDEDTSYTRQVLNAFMKPNQDRFDRVVKPSTTMSKLCGNIYTASLYGNLLSLIANVSDDDLLGKRVFCFSYGSGMASSLFSLTVKGPLDSIRSTTDVVARLDARSVESPETFVAKLALREESFNVAPYTPVDPPPTTPGTFYLTQIDDMWRRTYERV